MYELMTLMAASPSTGDNFQSGKLFIVVGAAIAIALVSGVIAAVKGKNEDDDDDGEE